LGNLAHKDWTHMAKIRIYRPDYLAKKSKVIAVDLRHTLAAQLAAQLKKVASTFTGPKPDGTFRV